MILNGKKSTFNEHLIKNYDENSDKGYILGLDLKNPKWLHNLHNVLPFLPDRMKIKKWSKLVCNIYDKNNYVAHIRTLKQTLNYKSILKRVHKAIQFNQKAWIKPYIDVNTKLRAEAINEYYILRKLNLNLIQKINTGAGSWQLSFKMFPLFLV